MLPTNRAIVFLAATLLITPIFSATPASAEQKLCRRGVTPRREVNPRERRSVVVNQRVVRLNNGDFRLPNGEIVSNRRTVRLRNQSYFRLPNGDIIVPTQ
ncbi:hypothetical protein LC593_01095 [Nostoc sp. CHAB 5844]|nr:hypothetical protein [Nostoc sp. CHAB 5844]